MLYRNDERKNIGGEDKITNPIDLGAVVWRDWWGGIGD